MQGAHNVLLDVEELTEQELDGLRARYQNLARQARESHLGGAVDTGTPELQGA